MSGMQWTDVRVEALKSFLAESDIIAAESVKRALLDDPDSKLSNLVIQTRKQARDEAVEHILCMLNERHKAWGEPHVGDDRYRDAGRSALYHAFVELERDRPKIVAGLELKKHGFMDGLHW